MTNRQPGQPSKLWLAFAQDSFEMPMVLVFGLFGLASLLFADFLTPPSVAGVAVWTLILVWHITMALGLMAAIGRVFELERLELGGLACLAFSCLFYLIAAAFTIGPASIGLTSLLLGVTIGCVGRGSVLRKSIKGQKMVQHVVEELRHNGNRGAM